MGCNRRRLRLSNSLDWRDPYYKKEQKSSIFAFGLVIPRCATLCAIRDGMADLSTECFGFVAAAEDRA